MLRTLGKGGKVSNGFWSYLSDRKRLVEIQYDKDNTMQRAQSELADVQKIVPQVTVLGPVHLILLTNDLPNSLLDACHTVMYADDTFIKLAIKSI